MRQSDHENDRKLHWLNPLKLNLSLQKRYFVPLAPTGRVDAIGLPNRSYQDIFGPSMRLAEGWKYQYDGKISFKFCTDWYTEGVLVDVSLTDKPGCLWLSRTTGRRSSPPYWPAPVWGSVSHSGEVPSSRSAGPPDVRTWTHKQRKHTLEQLRHN